MLNLRAHCILNKALIDKFGLDMALLPGHVAAVYQAVRAGGHATNRVLFVALPSDTLRLVDASGVWANDTWAD